MAPAWTLLSALLATAASAQPPAPPAVVPYNSSGTSAVYAASAADRPSMRLLQVQLGSGGDWFNPFAVMRGTTKFEGADLPHLVADYPDAKRLADEANSKFQLATGLVVGALVADTGSIAMLIGAIATQPSYSNQLSTTSAVFLGVGVGLLVVGITLSIFGTTTQREAAAKWLEALNTYNREMLDGTDRPIPGS
jgi:hypothetical protein